MTVAVAFRKAQANNLLSFSKESKQRKLAANQINMDTSLWKPPMTCPEESYVEERCSNLYMGFFYIRL